MNEMSEKRIDGKIISRKIKEEVQLEIEGLKKEHGVPVLAVILCGNNSASQIYVKNKEKACEAVGIQSLSYVLEENTQEQDLLNLVQKLNKDSKVHGILVQLPLPKQISESKVIEAIDPLKDVDGFHPINTGKLFTGLETFLPCTPAGIMEMLKEKNIDVAGKHCVVLGRSNIVGKPIALLMLQANATVTICHSKTENIQEITKQADILIGAIGIPNYVKKKMIKEGAILIDVGINRLSNGKICGDMDYEDCLEKAAYITPVPGGVGVMTIAMLMKNCLQAFKNQEHL